MARGDVIRNRTGGVNVKQVNRHLAREGKKYPDHMIEVPKDQWPPAHNTAQLKCVPLSLWRSNKFMAQVVQEPGGHIRISINRTRVNENYDYVDGIGWDDLQRIKNEIGYADHDCVELYPANADVVNVANIRHLFVLTEKSPFNWSVDND